MKKTKAFIITALTAAMFAVAGCKSESAPKSVTITENSSDIQKASYSIGYVTGIRLHKEIPDLDLKAFEKGIADGRSGDESKGAFTKEQIQQILDAHEKNVLEKLVKEIEEKAKANKENGEKFLAENKTKEGVQTTASGLQYKVITEGTGAKPKATDNVTVHYEGKLIDGKVFDSSYERGAPIEFPLNGGAIAGWTEGLQLMPAGSKYELYIPSELAYGENGTPDIEPNSVLIFTVELLDEESAKKAKAEAQKTAEAQQAQLEAQIAEMMKEAPADAKSDKAKK